MAEKKSKAVFNWSGGKDSALALFEFRRQGTIPVEKLLTNTAKGLNRSSAHGVRTELMQWQAEALGLPLDFLEIPADAGNESYNRLFDRKYTRLKQNGFTEAVFGDILLEELKVYREKQLHPLGFEVHFPLWGKDTRQIPRLFLELGFKAVVVAVDGRILGKEAAGMPFDEEFLSRLPATADPCGENGEYHTFVYDGPGFRHPVVFQTGEKVYEEYEIGVVSDSEAGSAVTQQTLGFWFCDLL